jgi:hypothetical protein
MANGISIPELSNVGDARGVGFTAPAQTLAFLGYVADVHVASIKPRSLRGNQHRFGRRQAIVVLPASPRSLHWDDGEAATAQSRVFDGTTAVVVTVPPGSSRAVRDHGECTLWLGAFLGKLRSRGNSREKGWVGLSPRTLSGLCGAPSKSWLARDPAWV